jgi:hypothetical protein
MECSEFQYRSDQRVVCTEGVAVLDDGDGVGEQLRAAVGNRRGGGAADRLCTACVELFAVDGAAVSLIFDGRMSATLGASAPSARLLDELQFTLGEGPCLDSVTARGPVMVPDLADPTESRWPAYGPAMLAREIRGVYAMPVIAAGQYLGALDLYRRTPGPLEAEQFTGALVAAELAQIPMLDVFASDLQAGVDDPGSDAWEELHRLLRAEVSQATGMLMAQLDVGAAEALVRLRAHAYATDASATEVARAILDRRLFLRKD